MFQCLQNDILDFLDQEIEDNEHLETEVDPSDLLQTLEDKTDQLKRQIVRRSSFRKSLSGECFTCHKVYL